MGIEELLPVKFPLKDGVYRIVQVELDGTQFLRFSNGAESDVHGLVLERFLREAGVEYETQRSVSGQRIPVPAGAGYLLRGAGYSGVNFVSTDSYASFHGSSTDYGLCVDEKALDEIRPSAPGWDLYIDRRM